MSLVLLQILMQAKVMVIPEDIEGLITPTHVLGVHRQVNFILADFEGSHPEELKAQALQNWVTDMLAPLGALVEI